MKTGRNSHVLSHFFHVGKEKKSAAYEFIYAFQNLSRPFLFQHFHLHWHHRADLFVKVLMELNVTSIMRLS